ncbi:MAG: MbcA/ParS/Xre antitoxin family protein [Nitrospiraceae bacterium]|nr:MbcA/ParS/Xre antitoxin family protein [Nitrospiraceae bacterium]
MTMGMMQGYRQAVQKFSGIKELTDEAIQDWLDNVLPTLPPRTQQIFVDELFFLTTGLPPMYADSEHPQPPKSARAPRAKTTKTRNNPQATQDAFDIQQRVSEVLGGEDAATAWLTRKHRALKNNTPLSILGTTAGNARVEQLLKRTKRSPLPVETSLKKMKTVASRKARPVSTIRKATD